MSKIYAPPLSKMAYFKIQNNILPRSPEYSGISLSPFQTNQHQPELDQRRKAPPFKTFKEVIPLHSRLDYLHPSRWFLNASLIG
jgi:hypothetical protein